MVAFAAGVVAGAEAAGAVAGLFVDAGAAIGEAADTVLVDFAGVTTGAAPAGGAAADAEDAVAVVDFFERLFLGVAVSELAFPAAGVVVACSVAVAADFFERDFFGLAASSVVAVLATASAFFDELFFFGEEAPASDVDCEAEVSASAFFFFLLFVAVLESLLV